jgi:phosphatidate cytidylyltransferase
VSSMHTKRVITAAIAIAVVLLVILKGGQGGVAILAGLTVVAGLLEYYSLFLPEASALMKTAGLVFGLALTGFFYSGHMVAGLGIFAAATLVFAFLALARFGSQTYSADLLPRQITGFVYIPFFLGHVVLIGHWHNGIIWLLFLLAVVFSGDTAAYYTGKTLGRHKLCPAISPGKTVEGAIGGLAGSLLAGSFFKVYALADLSWLLCVGLALLLGVIGQVGDLVESMLKRSVKIKDSGTLLPGHGGVLDRIDGLLFAAPVLYYFKTFLL